MPQVSNIVLPDALATPVNHTFIPLGPDKSGVWHFEDQSGGIAAGFQRISVSLNRATPAQSGQSSTKVNRLRLAIALPRLETMSGSAGGFVPSPVVAYVERASVEVIIPERATSQDRKDARKYLVGLLANPLVISAFEDLQNIY